MPRPKYVFNSTKKIQFWVENYQIMHMVFTIFL